MGLNMIRKIEAGSEGFSNHRNRRVWDFEGTLQLQQEDSVSFASEILISVGSSFGDQSLHSLPAR